MAEIYPLQVLLTTVAGWMHREQYLEHYHRERNHQGFGNWLIEAGEVGASELASRAAGWAAQVLAAA